jgi:Ca-activated chloride channel homolog
MMSRFSGDRRWPMCLVLLLLLPVLGGWELLRRRSASIEAGNGHMKAGKPEEALGEYDKAIAELPADPGAHFDRGTALSALSRFDEAAQEFLRATEAKDIPLKSEAFYNLGNAFFKKDKFKEAVAAYRRSLELDPRNDRAKWNSEIALKKQREDDKKKQDQKDKDKDKPKKKDDKGEPDKDKPDDQKKEDKKDEPKKDEDKKNEDKKNEDKKNEDKKDEPKKDEDKVQKPNDQKPAEQPNPPQPEDKPPAEKSVEQQEMESALDGLDKSPKELEKQRALLRAVRRAPPTRDW